MDRIKQEHKENTNGISSTNGISIQSNESSNYLNGTKSEIQSEERQRHDLFLSTYEKPTQIYRYLRTRHFISHIFLHRTLSYMKERMSRDHSKRNNFKIDSLFETLQERKLNEIRKMKFGNLIIKFTGIQNKNIDNKSIVNVTVSLLLKMNSQKSNSLLMNNEIVIGECKLNLNDNGLTNRITIQKENFMPISPNSKAILLFKVTVANKSSNNYTVTNSTTNGDHNYDNGDLPVKRRKTSTSNNELITTFKAGLDILGKNQECLLKDGEYHLTLNEFSSMTSLNGETKIDNVYDRLTFWQTASQLNSTFLKDLNQAPCLIFYLNWSSDHDSIHQSPMKPYSIKSINHSIQPLKQIDPPNTEINNNKSFSKNSSNRKQLNGSTIHMNGTATTNGHTTNGYSSSNSNSIDHYHQHTHIQSLATTAQKPEEQKSNSINSSSKVIYRFWFNNQLLQQTKPHSDFKCPWCGLNCLQFLSLKHHLKYNHSRFNFTFSLIDSRGYKVDVTMNDFYDGSYDGNPQQDMTNFSSKIKGPIRRTPATLFLINLRGKARTILTEMLDSDTMDIDFIKPHVFGHNRLYYHSGTCQPIRPHELDFDSEDEVDPEWMKRKTQLMIDEFTDVNEGEKEVMKLWNLHMMKYNYVGGVHLPLACEMFINENWKEIIYRKIYMNFILHLNNLFDYGLLTSDTFRKIVRLYHEKSDSLVDN